MNTTSRADLPVGVIGVGSMGKNHARVYNQLSRTDLVGVFDADNERAAEIAAEHGTVPMGIDELLDSVSVSFRCCPDSVPFRCRKTVS